MAEDGVVEIQMPAMGESVTEGTILEWVKDEGEFVEEGETVVEVSTDKVDAEVPAPASGVIAKILAQADDTVQVGQALAQLDPNGQPSGNGAGAETGPGLTEGATGEGDADLGEGPPENQAGASGEAAVAEAAGSSDLAESSPTAADAEASESGAAGGVVELTMPEMGESVTEGTVLEWVVQEGEAVSEGDTVIEVSTDKVDAEVPAPVSGTVT
jgi:pyruvate/2-oxoglutarate dehydrogenase complex dihydrolipoamide acyltransferase (E2) component